MAPAAPSREPPSLTTDLDAGATLRLGEFSSEMTLNVNEARLILTKVSLTRLNKMSGDETEVLLKTRDYLEVFAAFKEQADCLQLEQIIELHGAGLERFEQSQIGNLLPSCADEALTLIPSLEGKIGRDELEALCAALQRHKMQASLQ